MVAKRVQGKIIRFTGHEVWVDIGAEVIPTLLRGRFRKKGKGVPIVAGDRVKVDLPEVVGAPGTIEEVLPRDTWLSKVSGARDAQERVIVANIDRLFFVVAARDPKLNTGFIDRVLVSAEQGHNSVYICLNKVDLMGTDDEAEHLIEAYAGIGYPVLRVSAKTGEGIDQIAVLLEGGVYAFVGQSGVGKSSILNRIDSSLNLKVANVALKTGRGRHTTTFSQLYPIKGGYMADTPGMQTFGFPGTDKEELASCFREFRDYEADCRFQPCTHSHEPDCAVKAAYKDDKIVETRYQNYLSMLVELEDRVKDRY